MLLLLVLLVVPPAFAPVVPPAFAFTPGSTSCLHAFAASTRFMVMLVVVFDLLVRSMPCPRNQNKVGLLHMEACDAIMAHSLRQLRNI